MAHIPHDAAFDPDDFDAPIVGLGSRMGPHDSGVHQHNKGQLLFTYSGSIRITTPELMSLLPPIHIAWIPPRTAHRAQVRTEVDYRSAYLDPIFDLGKSITIIRTTPLLREVLERISHAPFDTDWTQGAARNLLAVCLDELSAARQEPLVLPMPTDPRLAKMDFESLPPTLDRLAEEVGASARTITRIFQRETGMGYQLWRSTWRLLRAVDLLASGLRITDVASELDFASDSAFITFFRQMTGQTPRSYVQGMM